MKTKFKNAKGITLIALVITIIVLLILAGVTIATLTGDNGILGKANDAKTQTEQAKEDENLKIAIAGSYGTDGKLNLKDLKDNLTNQGIDYDKNNTGFPLEVTVNGEKKKIDANGNIIETGENAIKKANKETVDIALGRYSFTQNSDGTITTSEYSGSYTEDTTANHNSDYKNAIAKDIEEFKTSVKNNHGYYIGRYEAGVVDYNSSVSTSNSNNKIDWTGYTGDNIKLVCKKEQQVWNYVTQNKASELSRDMYKSEAKVTSDLINSYAWDTAIVFIQKCGTESNSSTYSKTDGLSSTGTNGPQTTGTNILNVPFFSLLRLLNLFYHRPRKLRYKLDALTCSL